MEKVLVKVYFPVLQEQFDVWIPQDKKIEDIIELLVQGLNELKNVDYNPSDTAELYDKLTGLAFDTNKTVKQCNIKNATEIVLI